MQFLGKKVYFSVLELGYILIFTKTLFITGIRKPFVKFIWVQQLYQLGVKSLGVVSFTALFIGLAFAVQILNEFLKFGASDLIGGVVSLAVWRELAPLMSATVMAARVGSALSAEIATLKISEQLLAFRALSKDIHQWIFFPRLMAVVIMVPLLVIWANIVGVLAGYVVVFLSPFVNANAYFESIQKLASAWDFCGGIIKAFVFAIIIGILACYYGYSVKGGTEGVAKVTRKMVVVALLSIFVVNYILSLVLF